ncbi:probable inactive DNA (cytosine-5)-methyltransferase DRM3 isoform X1 [Tanacetum coccineum]
MPNLFVPILIFSLSFLVCNSYVALGRQALAGGWKPIDASDPEVIGIGKFAVNEHNKEEKASLNFIKVVKGESQVVAGMKYNLTIKAADGSVDKNYEAVVWDKPWQKFRQLVSFKGTDPFSSVGDLETIQERERGWPALLLNMGSDGGRQCGPQACQSSFVFLWESYKPPMTIEEAILQIKKYWPSWDTRKWFSCISSETLRISQLCNNLKSILKSSKGILYAEQQKNILHQCRTLSLMWVGRNRLAPTHPESVEGILGYPLNHTWIDGLSLGERLHFLKHTFQTHTLGYHLFVLKSLFPDGITLLSIYSEVGGANITLNRFGIRLKAVVSIEPSKPRRKILRQWWENSDQKRELVQIATIKKLSSSKLGSLTDNFGVFDFIIC